MTTTIYINHPTGIPQCTTQIFLHPDCSPQKPGAELTCSAKDMLLRLGWRVRTHVLKITLSDSPLVWGGALTKEPASSGWSEIYRYDSDIWCELCSKGLTQVFGSIPANIYFRIDESTLINPTKWTTDHIH